MSMATAPNPTERGRNPAFTPPAAERWEKEIP